MVSLAHSATNDTRFEDAIKRASSLGKDSVKSALSKPNLAIDLVRGIADGVFDDDDKVNAQFDAYLAARTKEVAKNSLAQGLSEDNENSLKANRSKHNAIAGYARHLMTLEADPVELLQEVMDRRVQLIAGDRKVKPTYDCFVDVARAQKGQPLEVISGDALDAIICKPETKEKDTLKKLQEEYSRVYRLAAQMGDEMLDCTYIEQARDSIADAIRALDGEVPSMSKADKKDDELIAMLVGKGYSKEDARLLVKR